jgi:ATP-dependent DNA ligase
MLAQLEQGLPHGDRWAYEPKLDGFRGQLLRRGGAPRCCSVATVAIWRPCFQKLARVAECLPRDTLLDCEIVITDETGQADFGALQLENRDA